ncbi:MULTISPECIES: hypothetical protein [Stenotrophomonas]|uniref:hypothetical protein n=1 Tax=Stenotrophomonas TaxID=40323 RepID=UPI0013DC69A9|nr:MULTISPECIES: hypothetical protein [Stenotrophomonas]
MLTARVLTLIMAVGASLFSPSMTAAAQGDGVTESFAGSMGITYEEAAQRLALREEAIKLLIKLDPTITTRFAGKDFVENPMVITIRLKGDDPVAPQFVKTPHGTVSIVFVVGATYSLEDLRTVIDSGKVRQAFPEAHGLGIDGQRGEIHIDLPDEYFDADHALAREAATRSIGVPIQLRRSRAAARNL